MKTKIKICGLRTPADIRLINENPVDYAGFVFAPSRRRVTPAEARAMRKQLDGRVKAVGIFVNEAPAVINQIVEACGIDIVQLHGAEPPEVCGLVKAPVWKAVAMTDAQAFQTIKAYGDAAGILLDGPKAGSGAVFDWIWAKGFPDSRFTILAGGLNPENVQGALEAARPHVVDVSSGVESNGIKNREKIIAFIRKVNEYDTQR